MKASRDAERAQGQEALFTWKHRLPIFLAISIGMFNQLSGINAILYYLNDIFAKAGFSKVSSDLQSVAIGATNLLFTMLAMTLIDKVGRKTLLLIGSVGTAAVSGGRRGGLLFRHRMRTCWSGCWSVSSPSSRSRKARSSGSISARSFRRRCAPKDKAWGAFRTG